jgi:hypothetical protein
MELAVEVSYSSSVTQSSLKVWKTDLPIQRAVTAVTGLYTAVKAVPATVTQLQSVASIPKFPARHVH